jgi:hypothetical protein
MPSWIVTVRKTKTHQGSSLVDFCTVSPAALAYPRRTGCRERRRHCWEALRLTDVTEREKALTEEVRSAVALARAIMELQEMQLMSKNRFKQREECLVE